MSLDESGEVGTVNPNLQMADVESAPEQPPRLPMSLTLNCRQTNFRGRRAWGWQRCSRSTRIRPHLPFNSSINSALLFADCAFSWPVVRVPFCK
jgi:hypothetical protein